MQCSLLTLSSGENSVEVDTESEDKARGLAWEDRSDVEVLEKTESLELWIQ